MKKNNDAGQTAFTLAEVLITLTIIGIIAALTIPNLMQSYRKHQVEVGVKEAYSMITNAIKLSEAENGSFNETFYDTKNNLSLREWSEKYFLPYLKVVKYDTTPNALGGLLYSKPGTEYMYDVNGKTILHTKYGIRGAVLSNGMIIGITYSMPNESFRVGVTFIVDINGLTGPNLVGHDVHMFTKFTDGIYANCQYPNNIYCNRGQLVGGRTEFVCHTKGTCNGVNPKCSIDANYCTSEIVNNGFNIPDDYPVKKW